MFKIKTINVFFGRYWDIFNPNPQKIEDVKQYENDLDFKGIDFPVKLKDITKFENQSP